MSLTLTWLDHDPVARDRSLRILALFREKESRDELGLGAVRDAIADRLFPGTSTIQTRIRYMLLVPWIYRSLEERRVPASKFAQEARRMELELIRPLLDADEQGVFGATAGQNLKRLPSSVYWAGLGTWGIRRRNLSQWDYHAAVDRLYDRTASRSREDGDTDQDANGPMWRRLPLPPAGFPREISLTLSPDEATFLRDCIVTTHGDSMLGWLALHGLPDNTAEPWLHHQVRQFPQPVQRLLEQARRFSDLIEGAARLYNVQLASKRGDADLEARHRQALKDWRGRLDVAEMQGWSLDALWDETVGQGHNITQATRTFTQSWLERVVATHTDVADDAEGRRIVQRREEVLKGPRSRFLNPGALSQWGGDSGTGRLVYRWPTARRHLDDLLPALGRV